MTVSEGTCIYHDGGSNRIRGSEDQDREKTPELLSPFEVED